MIHIAAAGAWFGANVMQAVVPTMAAKQSVETAAGWYRIAGQLSKRYYTPAAIILLLTGVAMVINNDTYGFGTLFVTIGFGMIVIGALIGIFVLDPGATVAADVIESGDPGEIKAAVARMARFGTIDTLLLLFTITAMVLRLGV